MFPESEKRMIEEFKMQNSMRILPHQQNSGGFFLALIKKNSHVEWEKSQQGGTGVQIKEANDLNELTELIQQDQSSDSNAE